MNRLRIWLLGAAATCALLFAGAAPAQTMRVATAFDPQTMDPHALALLYHTRVSSQIYEALVHRDAQYRLEPALALSWQAVAPTVWRFKLRPNVRFHDGTAFTAADARFSIERAMAPPSLRAFQLRGLRVREVDALTIDIELEAPDAVLPEKLFGVAMMSRAWCEQHGVTTAQDFNGKQETFAVRNANGTGPFRLLRYEPDARTTLERFAGWWGWQDGRSGNVRQAHFVMIKSDATRLAALASGEVDAVLDPPYQDIARLKNDGRVTVLSTADLGQQYLAFDQARDELQDSDIKGRNPFKDLRVRQAVYHALNLPLIVDKVLRGQAQPTGAFLSPRLDGSLPELDKRLPYDPTLARQRLAEAGYPDGFSVTLDCVNVAWRENVCQAMAAMLTQVGIRTRLRSSVSTVFFPKLSQGQGSFVEFGWTPGMDPYLSLNGLLRSYDKSGLGTFNAGRYSNPRLDALIDQIRVEPDLTRRRALVTTVLRLVQEELPLVPLYRRTLNWALARKVHAVQWPSDTIELRWVRVQVRGQ